MKLLVQDKMTKAFTLLPATLTPGAARQQLPENHYGVITDAQGAPVALVTAHDLQQADQQPAQSLLHTTTHLPPALLLGCKTEMKSLAESETFDWVVEYSVHGAILLDDQGVVGVLPIAAIDEYLGSGEYGLPSKTMAGPSAKLGDSMLGGSHQTPLAVVLCIASVNHIPCGYLNRLTFFDPHHPPPCQNPASAPHTLEFPIGEGAESV